MDEFPIKITRDINDIPTLHVPEKDGTMKTYELELDLPFGYTRASFRNRKLFVDSRGYSLSDIYDDFRIEQLHGKKNEMFSINYGVVHPGVVKAWHRHALQDDYFCVIRGNALIGVYDPVTHFSHKMVIGERNPTIIHIPAGCWHGLTAVGNEDAGLLYLITNVYNHSTPDEERAPHTDFCAKDWWLPPNV